MNHDRPNPANEPDYEFDAEKGRRELDSLLAERKRLESKVRAIMALCKHAVDEVNIGWHHDYTVLVLEQKLSYGPFPGLCSEDELLQEDIEGI
jgi:hypothetical protein